MMLVILAAFAQGTAVVPSDADLRPSLAFQATAGDARNFWKYFYFWKPGVTLDTARADLAECHGYARDIILFANIPERMSESADSLRPSVGGGPAGPVAGAVAFALVEGGLTNRIVLANLRKCMGFKGYRRYGLTRALWRQLNEGDPERVIERMAIAASGPEPIAASLDP